jgi:hypothetical protein
MRSRTEIAEEAAMFAETTVDALMTALSDRDAPVSVPAPHHRIRPATAGQITLPRSSRLHRFDAPPTLKKAVPGRIYH